MNTPFDEKKLKEEEMPLTKSSIQPFEKFAVGKNIHSVYTLCFECKTWGVNMPLQTTCGDCQAPNGMTYYDAKTVQKIIDHFVREAQLNPPAFIGVLKPNS